MNDKMAVGTYTYMKVCGAIDLPVISEEQRCFFLCTWHVMMKSKKSLGWVFLCREYKYLSRLSIPRYFFNVSCAMLSRLLATLLVVAVAAQEVTIDTDSRFILIPTPPPGPACGPQTLTVHHPTYDDTCGSLALPTCDVRPPTNTV